MTHSTGSSSRGAGGSEADYVFDIFHVPVHRSDQLNGSVYRFWCSHALAWVLSRRLSGRIDFLDAGGRDGGTVQLLEGLGLAGRYTCLDLNPVIANQPARSFEVDYVRSSFGDFKPDRQFDAVLFQSSLEYVHDLTEISWLAGALKSNGFAVVLLITRDTERIYPGVWGAGGRNALNRNELETSFAPLGLRVVEVMALVGAAGRAVQYLLQLKLAGLLSRVVKHGLGWAWPSIYKRDLMRPFNRLLNEFSWRADRYLRFGRMGHCIVLERGET